MHSWNLNENSHKFNDITSTPACGFVHFIERFFFPLACVFVLTLELYFPAHHDVVHSSFESKCPIRKLINALQFRTSFFFLFKQEKHVKYIGRRYKQHVPGKSFHSHVWFIFSFHLIKAIRV